MKVLKGLVLCGMMAIFLTGCGKSDAVKNVEKQIDEIGTVTIDSNDLIAEARENYDDLSEEDKADVENYDDLVSAENDFGAAVLTELSSDTWLNATGSDKYEFGDDYTGKHDSASITFEYTNGKIIVTEGSGSTSTREFTWDRSGSYDKIIPSDANTYYVKNSNFEEVSKVIREENTNILTGEQFWKPETTDAYMNFYAGGTGNMLMMGYTFTTTWEFTDNDSIKVRVDFNGGQILNVDIVNDNGSYKLVTKDGAVTYLPYNQ